jgi:hypothetical protein
MTRCLLETPLSGALPIPEEEEDEVTWISESMSTRSNQDSSGLSEEKAMEAFDIGNVAATNQGE